MSWTLHTDADNEPTLWHDGIAILSRSDLRSPGWGVGTPDERAELDALLEQVWSVLTGVLAPDEATIERLAREIHARECGCPDDPPNAYYNDARRALRDVLAALTGGTGPRPLDVEARQS